MDMQSKIWVIGDSHTRAFSYNDNFIPFYIGEGKEHCLLSDQRLSNLILKVLNIVKEVKAQDSIILFMGEPDTRFYLGSGWKPWKKKLRFPIRGRSKIKKSFKRYCQLINEVKNKTNARLLILNITPSNRKDQNKLVNYFNRLLSEYCLKEKDVAFIDINTAIYNPETKTVREEYYGDPVHLNMKLQLPVENWLIGKGIIERSFYNEESTMDKKKLRENFKFNDRFGCYTL